MLKLHLFYFFLIAFLLPLRTWAQHQHQPPLSNLSIVSDVAPQPLLAHAVRLKEALSFIGSSLADADAKRLSALKDQTPEPSVAKAIQKILDPYCLVMVDINPEARVKVLRGPAAARLAQHGWTSFLVKIKNDAGVTAALDVESSNAEPPLQMSSVSLTPNVNNNHNLTPGQVANRFLEMVMYRNRPLLPHLSGLKLEYAVLQIYSKDAGQREAEIGFNIGQGTQDIGFRNTIPILFNIKKAVKVIFRVQDDDGTPAMASFTIRDGIDHYPTDSLGPEWFLAGDTSKPKPMAASLWALHHFMGIEFPKRLKGVYPLPARRVAAYDDYPDFFFQPQVYRNDGEYVHLTAGRYSVTFTRGPEYLPQTQQVEIPAGRDSIELSFHLKRWVNLAALGWHSADHHVHAAGCSHYESPEEGVTPEDMWRQQLGEDLNVASVLSWGPGWYHQKEFFSGNTNALSTSKNLIRYDVEVSGFPSQHAGHLVLLRLKEDDYPGTKKVEDWPSWTLPVLAWAKQQGAVTGYAHSGWGLEPMKPTKNLPNHVTPKMDGIGANEYIVAVAHHVVDFYSAGDTPAPWELNMWYHTLNCGFRPRLSGETDFPCITDERVGTARSYFKPEGTFTFEAYVQAIKKGRSYVSDGKSHIIDFSVNGVEAGVANSEVKLAGAQKVLIKANVAAYLPEVQDKESAIIAAMDLTEAPYWHIERARIGTSRNVPVELLVNGVPVDTVEIVADGKWTDVQFNYVIKQSSWVALRIYPSSHSNPIFIMINDKPIRIRESIEWCKKAVDQCWKMKQAAIRPQERPAAEAAYNNARKVYETLLQNAPGK